MKTSRLGVAFFLAATVAGQPNPLQKLKIPLPPDDGVSFKSFSAAATTGRAFFDQLLDHNDPSKGTFKQQYWWNSQYWAGPGSPVVVFNPGEAAAAPYTGYLTNRTITGYFAQELKGAVVMMEHRYYGSSSPFDTLTVENLQYLTIDQAIDDGIYFAKNAYLPFDSTNSSNADKAPWVLSGGSYSGMLSAFTESVAPGTFWAYHSSSAPVEADYDFWEYFAPIQAGMPKNCSKDVNLVIEYVDNVLKKGTAAEKYALKARFGYEKVEHDGDFGNILQGGPWNWQSQQAYSGYSQFSFFCDTIEGVDPGAAVTPDENGVGLEKAIEGYINWVKPADDGRDVCTYYGFDEYDFTCYDSTYANQTWYIDQTVDGTGGGRQWEWMLCNEPLGFWQDGAPRSKETIVSRFVTAEFWQAQCDLYFPTEVTDHGTFTYRSKTDPSATVHQVNKWTKGWRLEDTTRLTWTNGEYDPWGPASVSSTFRPGGPLESTVQHPVNVIPKGIHCYDLILANGVADPGTQAVIDIETKQIVDWVAEFYQQ